MADADIALKAGFETVFGPVNPVGGEHKATGT